jgi:hypothetical protein
MAQKCKLVKMQYLRTGLDALKPPKWHSVEKRSATRTATDYAFCFYRSQNYHQQANPQRD